MKPVLTSVDDLQARLRAIFVEGWDYASERSDYFQWKRECAESLRDQAAATAGRRVAIEPPVDLQNYWSLELSLTVGSPSRWTLSRLRPGQRQTYLILLMSTVAPVIEITLVQAAGINGGIEWTWEEPEQVLRRTPDVRWRGIVAAMVTCAEQWGHRRFGRGELEVPAPESFPPLAMCQNSPHQIRDYVFPGIFDG